MEPDFWHQRWQENLIGFHQAAVHPQLERFWPVLGVPAGARVLVPLCGKSLDMLWLSARHPVLGVEISPIAVEAFFREAGLEPVRRQRAAFTAFEAGPLQLLCGDFFDLEAGQLEDVRAVYDRASLVALPGDMRAAFAAHLGGLLSRAASMLLVSLEYEQNEMQGPPFAVCEREIRSLFEPQWSVELLEARDLLALEARFRERGLSRLEEKVYRLEPRAA